MGRRKKNSRRKNDKYRSGFEKDLARDLEQRGIEFKYEHNTYRYWLKKPRSRCEACGANAVIEEHNYTPDFFIGDLIIEAKGKFSARNRRTILAMKEQHPELDIRMVFMADNWLTKKHLSRYSDWCKKYGVPYAFKTVPEEWLS